MMSVDRKKDLLELKDLTEFEFEKIFSITAKLKLDPFQKTLLNKTIALIFTKSSTRTRVSFEVGIAQLGGKSLFLSPNDIQLGRGETIEDTSKVLSRYLDGIIIRTFDHKDIQIFAEHASIPVINGLTDLSHPCQVLTDLYTIIEKKGTLKGKKIVFIGDCKNNMAYSWLMAASVLGLHVVFTGHKDYLPEQKYVDMARNNKPHSDTKIEIFIDPEDALNSADVIYTDVWTSMGQEEEAIARSRDLARWQVNKELMKLAKPDAIFMHCLPAHRGEEVTMAVLEGENSVVFDQAENRMHVQKAILTWLFDNIS